MDWEFNSPLSNALLATNASTGFRPSTFFEPLFNDFEPITNRKYQPSFVPTQRTSFSNPAYLNNLQTNNIYPSINDVYNDNFSYNRPSLNSQFLGDNAGLLRNGNPTSRANDLNININVEGPNNKIKKQDPHANSLLVQQHQIMLQNQQRNRQLQKKISTDYQQVNNDDDYVQQPLNAINQNDNYNTINNNAIKMNQRPRRNTDEHSITSTDADPIQSASPIGRNHNDAKGTVYDKLYQEAFDTKGSYLNAMKEARNRDQRIAKRQYTQSDYYLYQKNFGFGKEFLPFETETKEEKKEKAKLRTEYARHIKERNAVIIDEQRKNREIYNPLPPRKIPEYDVSKRNRALQYAYQIEKPIIRGPNSS